MSFRKPAGADAEPDKPRLARRNGPAIHLAGLTIFWLASLAVVNPIGDFPLNDDWSFGLTVRTFLETGDFRPTGWTSMPLITNTLWGSFFCIPFGFSFTALRISTLAASWMAMAGTYWLMRELRQPTALSLLAALTLAVNPIYHALSNTFMTDVPFMAVTICAAIFLLKSLNEGSGFNLLLGTAFAAASVLSRQVGLAVPLAFSVVLILKRGFGWRVILCALAPSFVCVAALIIFPCWMAATGRLPALYNSMNEHLFGILRHPARLGVVFSHSIYLCVMYLGLFLSPLLIIILPNFNAWRPSRKWALFGCFLGSLATLTLLHGLCGKGFTMPMSGNILNEAGIGPFTLRDAFGLRPNPLPALPRFFWLLVTVVSVLGAAALMTQLVAVVVSVARQICRARLGPNEAPGVFLLLLCIIYLLPFFVSGFLDRYLIPIIPFLAAGILSLSPPAEPAHRKAGLWQAAFLIAGFALFSICGTRDYLTWNRVRWQALEALTKNKLVPPSDIDGGFEFNGYYLYSPDYAIRPGKSSWWVQGDTYQLTFQKRPGCSVFDEYHYTHWLPPYIGNILVLKEPKPK